MKKLHQTLAAALICLPMAAMAQLPSLKSLPSLPSIPSAGGGGDLSGQNDSLVRGYVAANKDVLLANSQMADALGLKDAAAKKKYQSGMAQLGQGLLKYIALSGPAQAFSGSLKSASPMMLPKLQSGVYVATQLPTGLSNLGTSMKNANAFAKSNDIPVPPDATKAMAAL